MNSYQTLSDLALVDLMKSDDHGAFNEIFSRYRTVLFTFAKHRLDDPEKAKDILHDTFTDIWVRREGLNIINLKSYLFTAIKYRYINVIRQEKVSDRYIDELRYAHDTLSEPADYTVRAKDLSALIDKEVAALPEKLREAFVLSRYKYLSRQDIALRLNLTEEGVKTRMRRALTILKTKFEPR